MNGGAGWGPGEDEPRKPGEQSGHRGAGRGLKREGQVDELVDDYPEAWGWWWFAVEQRRPAARLGQVAIKCVSCRRISVNVTEHRAQELRGRPQGSPPRHAGLFRANRAPPASGTIPHPRPTAGPSCAVGPRASAPPGGQAGHFPR